MIVTRHERARYYMHVGGEHLDAEERATLEKHLDACAECRAYAVELASLQTRLARAMRLRWQGQHASPGTTRTSQARPAGNGGLRHFMSSVGSLAAAIGVMAFLGWLLMTTGSFDAASSATAMLSGDAAGPSTPAASPGSALEAPSAAKHAMVVAFTASDTLIGYDLDREQVSAGELLTVTLHWELSRRAPGSKVNVVVHLLDAGGKSVARSNSVAIAHAPPPPGSSRDVVVDRIAVPFALALPDALPAGSYRLVVKSYQTDVSLYPGSVEGDVSALLTRLQVE